MGARGKAGARDGGCSHPSTCKHAALQHHYLQAPWSCQHVIRLPPPRPPTHPCPPPSSPSTHRGPCHRAHEVVHGDHHIVQEGGEGAVVDAGVEHLGEGGGAGGWRGVEGGMLLLVVVVHGKGGEVVV
jgi:hypothetical protein